METDNLNIEALLDFSKQQNGLIEGHQKAMQQVLATQEQLRVALFHEHQRANNLDKENKALKKQIDQLSLWYHNNTYNIQGDYIAGDKHVGAHIDNVQPGAIGAQTTKE